MRKIALLLVLAAAGCFTVRYTPVVHLALDIHPAVAAAAPTGKSLGIRPLIPGLPYKQNVVYRESGHVLSYGENVNWAEAPREVVTRAVADALVATGRFADVGDAADLRSPDLVLTGQIRKFDEVHTAEPWAAECEVRLELRAGLERRAVWAKTLFASEPLPRHDPAGLAEAMGKAVTRVAEQAAAAIAELNQTALEGPAPEGK